MEGTAIVGENGLITEDVLAFSLSLRRMFLQSSKCYSELKRDM